VILNTKRTVPLSIQQLVSVGVYPERQKILVVKGTIAPRAAYEPVSKLLIAVDSGGACAINSARFSYKLAPSLYGLEKRNPWRYRVRLTLFSSQAAVRGQGVPGKMIRQKAARSWRLK
jgi:microcystin degradation protein MlrC